jgi:hypothetical protein
MRPPDVQRPGGHRGEAGQTEAHDTPGDCSRSCALCHAPMPHAKPWWRLCGKCYRYARVDDHLRRALQLLREIQRADGVRR